MSLETSKQKLRTCVSPQGRFVFGLHQPDFVVANMRVSDGLETLGLTADGRPIENQANFPAGDVQIIRAQEVFEIPNPLPFRGTTYIGKAWADATARDVTRIAIKRSPEPSLGQTLERLLLHTPNRKILVRDIITNLPRSLRLAVATTARDPEDLAALAEASCRFTRDPQTGQPVGLAFEDAAPGQPRAKILDPYLFELVANNPALPDRFKKIMVLRPGAQGESEIVGEWPSPTSHIYEYLRSNSYIAWGHYAANMADDAVRYDAGALGADDIHGLRHLYYQRTYIRMAQALDITSPLQRRTLTAAELESLRCAIGAKIKGRSNLPFTATLWGWNYGFDFAPSGYRLHASHQQIHQQYALIPSDAPPGAPGQAEPLVAYACGDLVQEFVHDFRRNHGKGFFDCYAQAVKGNQRMDGCKNAPGSLVIYADDQVMLFVPKAQTSQWELQLMAVPRVGNILETDEEMRRSLDRAIRLAMRVLRRLGAEMITVIEYSKRFHGADDDQRLLYVFLPRLPESPGAFSEAQLRWINGHYPEDFAHACRLQMAAMDMALPD